VVVNLPFGVVVGSYVFDGLSATAYTFTLTTFTLSNLYSVSKSTVDTTYPAALSLVTLSSITSSSFTFEFEASAGAASYSYILFNQEYLFSFSFSFSFLFSVSQILFFCSLFVLLALEVNYQLDT